MYYPLPLKPGQKRLVVDVVEHDGGGEENPYVDVHLVSASHHEAQEGLSWGLWEEYPPQRYSVQPHCEEGHASERHRRVHLFFLTNWNHLKLTFSTAASRVTHVLQFNANAHDVCLDAHTTINSDNCGGRHSTHRTSIGRCDDSASDCSDAHTTINSDDLRRAVHGRVSSCRLCAWAFVVPCMVASLCLPLTILIPLLFCSFRAVHGRFHRAVYVDSSSLCSFRPVHVDVFHCVVYVLGHLSCLAWSLQSAHCT